MLSSEYHTSTIVVSTAWRTLNSLFAVIKFEILVPVFGLRHKNSSRQRSNLLHYPPNTDIAPVAPECNHSIITVAHEYRNALNAPGLTLL
jgi:hypothetical protein